MDAYESDKWIKYDSKIHGLQICLPRTPCNIGGTWKV